MYLMLCILLTVDLMEFPGFFGQFVSGTAWVSFSIFDCVDKTHPVGSVVLCSQFPALITKGSSQKLQFPGYGLLYCHFLAGRKAGRKEG